MSQQQKNILDVVVKVMAVFCLGIIGYFAERLATRAEETRDSVIRLEAQFNDHKEYSNNNDAYIKLKLQQLDSDIRNLPNK